MRDAHCILVCRFVSSIANKRPIFHFRYKYQKKQTNKQNIDVEASAAHGHDVHLPVEVDLQHNNNLNEANCYDENGAYQGKTQITTPST